MDTKNQMQPRAHSRSTRTLRRVGGIVLISGFLLALAPQPARAQCEANELAKLLASDGAAYDSFANSNAVAIFGDVAVIGALRHDHNGPDSGAAYVFRYTGTSWVEEAKLLGPGPHFGNSVAIEGDIIVIGAYADTTIGSAHVFRYDGSNWVQEAELLASDGASGDRFGDVAVFDSTIVVGAYGDNGNAGAVYVFQEPPGGWGSVPSPIFETAKLTACDAEPEAFFGGSVTITGDTAVIGAYADDNENGWNAGAVYIFQEGSGWVDGCSNEVAKLFASDGAAGDDFGYPVAISGETIVIGAYADDSGAGSAYVFERGAAWVDGSGNQVAKLVAYGRNSGDYFGHTVAIFGDIILVGAPRADELASNSGAAYPFFKPMAGWRDITGTTILTASDGAAGDEFARVAISGNTAVVGAIADDNENGENAGSAYVFAVTCGQPRTITIDIKPGSDPNSINLGSRGVIPVAILTTEDFDAATVDPSTVELAGSSVAIRGNGSRLLSSQEDVDGDGDIDLMLHIETENLNLETGSTEAVLTGQTYDGEAVTGTDTVNIVAD